MRDAAPFLSIDTIDWHARQVIADFQPDALCRPEPLDVIGLIRHHLPQLGLGFGTLDEEIMGEHEAWTEFRADGVHLMMREDHFQALLDGGEPALRARASVAHELGHAVLHQGLKTGGGILVLSDDVERMRQRTGNLEWQAWAFAGCLLCPTPVLLELDRLTPYTVANAFTVSPQLARRHLLRLRDAERI